MTYREQKKNKQVVIFRWANAELPVLLHIETSKSFFCQPKKSIDIRMANLIM
jgi:hypothetical protein